MFKIEAFVEDNKLGAALRALVGIARGQPTVMPVVNAEYANGKITAPTSGSLLAMFEAHLHKTKAEALSPDDIRKWIASHGKSPTSMTYLANNAIKHGLLKRVGKSSAVRFNIVRK